MKKIILSICICLAIASCTSKWEYKIVSAGSKQFDEPLSKYAKFIENVFVVNDSLLNVYGAEGWELVDVYEKTETVHPNFGDDKYVTGIQPNVRTSEISFVFKKKN